MKLRYLIHTSVFLLIAFVVNDCNKDDGLNLFSVRKDVEFGEQMDSMIRANPAEYPILEKSQYPEAYVHLERIRDDILTSDEFNHRDDFVWEVAIIDKDILNAFCAPAGYMYYYTGIIKYLDNEAQLAGVVAHEMAHADKRHTTKMLTRQYGLSIMLAIVLGDDPGTLASIVSDLALGLGNLKFSRNNEYEADEHAVKYSADTDYDPKGISGFFTKLEDADHPPEFLSTHPDPGNRLDAIDEVWKSIGSPAGDKFESRYQEFKASLPSK